MQENKDKKSYFFDRLLQVFDYYNIKNVTSFACDYLGYKSPEKINRLKDGNNKPSYDILCDISNKFDSVDIKWLITGQGEMLRTAILIESIQSVSPPPNDDIITLLKEQLKEKDTKIEIQAQEIGELRSDNRQLKEQIMGLDQQILKLSISLSKFQSTAGDAQSVHAP